MPDLTPTLLRLAARAAITRDSERFGRDRLADDAHDTLTTVLDLLEEAGIPLPDPHAAETQRVAWL